MRAPKFDDRSNFRYGPDYRAADITTALDWSAYPGAGGGFQGAVEMCNNNGACRALSGGVMCPSYRVTRDERDVTRGRANTLRLAITGQLGPDALTSDEMAETLKLCVSCKACRRECPTGVDMARMKIEVLRARTEKFGLSLHDRLVGYLPRYAPYAARLHWLFNLRDALPGAAKLSEVIAGFGAQRSLPKWRADFFEEPVVFKEPVAVRDGGKNGEVVLFADTFNRYFERENIDAALAVLDAAGYRVHFATPADGGRPLCCGRTFLSVGKIDEARREAERTLAALAPFVAERNAGASDWSRVACSASATKSRRCSRAMRPVKSPPTRSCSRNFWRARRPPGNSICRWRRTNKQGAAARPLPSEIFRHDDGGRGGVEAHPRSRSAKRSNRAAAAWPAHSATTPTRSRSRAPWANCRCCLRCARHPATPSSSPMARRAAIRYRWRGTRRVPRRARAGHEPKGS